MNNYRISNWLPSQTILVTAGLKILDELNINPNNCLKNLKPSLFQLNFKNLKNRQEFLNLFDIVLFKINIL